MSKYYNFLFQQRIRIILKIASVLAWFNYSVYFCIFIFVSKALEKL